MISLLLSLVWYPELDGPNVTLEQKAKYERLTLKREGLTQLGQLKTTTCRDEITTSGDCPSYEIATFESMESGFEFKTCFIPNDGYNNILLADEDIRLVHFGGFFYIVGETVNVGFNGSRGVLASTLIKITDCNPS